MYCRLFNKETSPPKNSSSCPIIIIIAATVVLIFRKQLLAFFYHNGKKLIQNCERIGLVSRSLVFWSCKAFGGGLAAAEQKSASGKGSSICGRETGSRYTLVFSVLYHRVHSHHPAEMQAAHAPKAEMKWWKY